LRPCRRQPVKDGAYFDGVVDGVSGTGFVAGFAIEKFIDTAGVISALLEGRDLPDAVRRGAWIGARAVQVLGDSEGLPTRGELDAARL
jgi:dehydrogluconokinase